MKFCWERWKSMVFEPRQFFLPVPAAAKRAGLCLPMDPCKRAFFPRGQIQYYVCACAHRHTHTLPAALWLSPRQVWLRGGDSHPLKSFDSWDGGSTLGIAHGAFWSPERSCLTCGSMTRETSQEKHRLLPLHPTLPPPSTQLLEQQNQKEGCHYPHLKLQTPVLEILA